MPQKDDSMKTVRQSYGDRGLMDSRLMETGNGENITPSSSKGPNDRHARVMRSKDGALQQDKTSPVGAISPGHNQRKSM